MRGDHPGMLELERVFYRPVLPKPPALRSVSSSDSTSWASAMLTGQTAICAMRSPAL